MLKRLYDYVMNIFDKQRFKNGNASTKVDAVKSRVNRETGNDGLGPRA